MVHKVISKHIFEASSTNVFQLPNQRNAGHWRLMDVILHRPEWWKLLG